MPSDGPADPVAIAASIVERVLTAPPTLGTTRLICIDGPAGTGKTTLSDAVARGAPGAQVVHGDDLLQGWAGLPGLAESVVALLAPLARGERGHWRRWDWVADAWAETYAVEPGGLLVLEGVGSWSPPISPWVGQLVWVEAASELRLARGIARDGEAMRPHWLRWRVDEDDLFSRHGTRDHADLVVVTG